MNAVAGFLDRYPLFTFGFSFVVFLVMPLVSDLTDRSRKLASAETAYSNLRDEVESHFQIVPPRMGAEDFAFYTEE